MISYEPFWNTLKDKGMTKYTLYTKFNISKQTLWRMSKNKPVLSTTIDDLCKTLNCNVDNIMVYVPDKDIEISQGIPALQETSEDYNPKE